MTDPQRVTSTGRIRPRKLLACFDGVRHRTLPTICKLVQERFELAFGSGEWYLHILYWQLWVITSNVKQARVLALDAENLVFQLGSGEMGEDICDESADIFRIRECGLLVALSQSSDLPRGYLKEPRDIGDEPAILQVGTSVSETHINRRIPT